MIFLKFNNELIKRLIKIQDSGQLGGLLGFIYIQFIGP